MGFDPNTGVTDVILGIGAVLALVALVRSWRSFLDADFTLPDRHLAMQVAVFLVPPAVVLLHELAHAVAVAAVGGHVTEFHYGLFEGAVSFAGNLTNGQVWFVALAGNLVSIGIGVAMAAAGGLLSGLRRSLRYLLIVGGLIEAVFGLVGYPMISESARFGDWLMIYDFSATPALSWATLVVHVAALVGLWHWWRNTLCRTLFGITYGEEARVAELSAAVGHHPDDLEARVALANLFAGYGDLKLAATTLDEGVHTVREPARLQLARARLAVYQDKWTQALLATQAGLAALEGSGASMVDGGGASMVDGGGASMVDGGGASMADGHGIAQQLWANQGVALTQLGRSNLALEAFARVDETLLADPRVRYCRGLARLGSGDAEGGRSDLSVVVGAAAGRVPGDQLLRRWAEARLIGREPDPPDDSDRPAWARRTKSPPAPIAGV
ncbi:MAG: hypothetical protein M3011_14090 [Actinomycetota bacterium]|nr:hypothetical protein [Actinomycetota bacterium]